MPPAKVQGKGPYGNMMTCLIFSRKSDEDDGDSKVDVDDDRD